jgi:hypothetical protein
MAIYTVTMTTDEGTTMTHGVEADSPQEACDLVATMRPPGAGAASFTASEE